MVPSKAWIRVNRSSGNLAAGHPLDRLVELNEVSHGVGEDGDLYRSHDHGRPSECNACSSQPRVVRVEIGRFEGCKRNALREHGCLERLGGWVLVGFEGKLQIISPGRCYRDPSVLTDR